jgi:O-antigen/teichoic acid export membrane protein
MIARNFSFNFAGKMLPVIFSLVAIPIYVHYLGIANYALIGIFTSFSAFAGIFDTGFSNTINREVAKDSGAAVRRTDLGALFRTLEAFAWIVALAIGLCIIAAAGPIVNYWIAAHSVPTASLVRSVELMGLLLMLQAPMSFYTGSLYGMHRHGAVNVILVSSSFASAVVAVAVLAFVSPTIEAFFLAQFVCRVVAVLFAGFLSHHELLKRTTKEDIHISLRVWRTVWRFAVSMNGIGVLGLVTSQADMVILSRMLSLREFGYYALARTMAQGLSILGVAVFQTGFPHLSQLVGRGETTELVRLYHYYCQVLSLLVLPAAVILCLYSHDVLLIWTRNPNVAAHASTVLALLAAGWGINALGNVPSAFMLSRGVTRLILYMAAANLVLMVPITVFLALRNGAVGGALGWLFVNAFLLLAGLPLMHRWYMPHQFGRWISVDVGLPLLAATIPAFLLKIGVPANGASTWVLAARLGVAALLAFVCCGLALPEMRRMIGLGSVRFERYRALLGRTNL